MPIVSPAYPTRDRAIPARWFSQLVRYLPAVQAAQELTTGHGMAYGKVLTDSKPGDTRVGLLTRNLLRRAVPMVRVVKGEGQ